MLKVAQWRTEGGIENGERSHPGLSETAVRAQVLFEDVTGDFFSGPDCPYLKQKRKSNGSRASSSVALDKSLLDNWIAPFFRGVKVARVDGSTIDKFVEHLRQEGKSSSHIHNIVSTAKKVFHTLYLIDRVSVDVSKYFMAYSRSAVKVKDAFSVRDVQEMLVLDAPFAGSGDLLAKKWTMMALCFLCGLRTGELLASRWDRVVVQEVDTGNLGFDRRGYLLVDTVWEREAKGLREGTKTYGKRYVPIPSLVFDLLYDRLLDADLEALIFESEKKRGQPLYGSVIADYMTSVCRRLDIKKHISPHRGRDWFQSVLTGKVSRDLIDYAIGHSQGKVRDTYQQAVFEQLEPIRLAMEEMTSVEVKSEPQNASDIRRKLDALRPKRPDLGKDL
jgi:integrase